MNNEEIIKSFAEYIKDDSLYDLKNFDWSSFFKFFQNKGEEKKEEKTAEIVFTKEAWIKQKLLVEDFSTEIGWHGTVERISENVWRVKDIFVYPQTVTGATVSTKGLEKELEDWSWSLSDEDFNSLRFQGHSHVNMKTFPSGTDEMDQKGYIERLKGQEYYIFQIWNKKGDIYSIIYDLENNHVYEDKDIFYSIENLSFDFLDEAHKKVKKRTVSTKSGKQISKKTDISETNTAISNDEWENYINSRFEYYY